MLVSEFRTNVECMSSGGLRETLLSNRDGVDANRKPLNIELYPP